VVVPGARLEPARFTIADQPADRVRLGAGTLDTFAVSPDETLVAVGGSLGVHLFGIAPFEYKWTAMTPLPVVRVIWSPNAEFLVAVLRDRALVIDSRTGAERYSLGGFAAPPDGRYWAITAAISPDAQMLAAGGCLTFANGLPGCDRALMLVWDTTTGAQIGRLEQQAQ
jgi:hypothetical protein